MVSRPVVRQGFKQYLKEVPVSARAQARPMILRRVCTNFILKKKLGIPAFKEPQFSAVLKLLKGYPENDFYGTR